SEPGPKSTESSTLIPLIRWLFAPNHRCSGSHAASGSDGGGFDAIADGPALARLEAEPVEVVGAEAQEVRTLADRGEARLPEQLDRDGAAKRREIELDGLRRRGEVRHDQQGLVLPAAQERE